MTTFIEHYRLFKVSAASHRFILIILLLIGSMATATLVAQEAPEGLAFLKSLGIEVTPHEEGNKFLPGQRVFETKVGQSQTRAYRFHSTKMDITYVEVKLVAPEDWKFGRFTKGKVPKGNFLYVEIIFQPQKARASEATLVFKLKQPKFLGANTVTVKIPLIGKGIVPAPKPILPGDKIIPIPKLDEGPDKTEPRDTSVKTICLDFILVDNNDTEKWEKKAREWIEKSNEIFKKSEVKVVFSKPKPVRKIAKDKIKKEADKSAKGGLHCFPVFIVKTLPDGVSNALGYTASEYIGDDRDGDVDEKFYNGKKADKLARDHGIHTKYRGGMAYGTAIYILQDLDISGVVLAHELGHVLGGGVSERVKHKEAEELKKTEEGKLELARRQSAHLDPKTGAELDDTDRLMNGQNIRNSSPKITPLEKIIIEWTAENFVAPKLSKCNQTYKSLTGYYGMIENASISNGGDEFFLTTQLFEPLVTEGLFLDYRLSFDTNGDGVGDRVLINTYDGEVWNSQLENISLDADAKPALRFLRRPDGTAHAIAASIPKAMLQKSQGIIGWNILLEIPDLGSADFLPLLGQTCSGKTRKSLPDLKVFNGDGPILSPARSSGGFDCFDITNPSLALQAVDTGELIPVFAGDIFELEGSLAVSSTFSGEVDLYVGYLHPESGIMKEVLVKHLSEIQAEMGWTASVPVPPGLAPGFYQLVITAVCELCKTETTAFGPTVSVGQFKQPADLNLFPEPYGGQWDSSEGEKEILLNSRDKVEFQMPVLR